MVVNTLAADFFSLSQLFLCVLASP